MTILEDKIDAILDLVPVLEADHHHSTADKLQTLRMLRDTADSALESAVAVARREGMSWEQIGRWLGVSKQSAHERYGPR